MIDKYLTADIVDNEPLSVFVEDNEEVQADMPEVVVVGVSGGSDVVIDPTLTIEGAAADAKAVGDRLSIVEDSLSDLLYTPIAISSFSNNVNTKEIGSTVTSVTFSWKFNKTPKSVTFDGSSEVVTSTGKTLSGLTLKSNKTWTLKATDDRGATASKTSSISFLNGVYYGVSAEPSTIDSEFVKKLTKSLRSNKLTSINVTAGVGQYIFYCLPTRFGTCTFTVGGFTGGFSLVKTFSFTNASGYTETYYVYKSDNANLGATKVTIA